MSYHHVLSRTLPALLLAGAAGLAAAVPAGAQAVATASPDVAGGKPAKLAWTVDGMASPLDGRIPKSLTVTGPGFGLDLRAIRKRCRKAQATLNECPKGSKMGTGVLTILVHRPAGPIEVPFDITLYKGRSSTVLAHTFFIGDRVIPGTLQRSGGAVVLTFDPLPVPPPIPDVSYQFKGVSVDLGVTRRVTKRRGGGRRHKQTVRYSLLRTPAECSAGSWASTAAFAFPDAVDVLLQAPMTCRSA